MSFERIWPLVLSNEGVNEGNPTGYADIPGDPGGETKWGISQRAWSDIQAAGALAFVGFPHRTKDLTKAQAEVIYRVSYYLDWFPSLPTGVQFLLFDCQVNQGRATKICQRAIGVKPDGVWGPASQTAMRLALRDIPKFEETILWERLRDYKSLNDPNDFLRKLWIPRLFVCRKLLASL